MSDDEIPMETWRHFFLTFFARWRREARQRIREARNG